jgi:hypothetical protein
MPWCLIFYRIECGEIFDSEIGGTDFHLACPSATLDSLSHSSGSSLFPQCSWTPQFIEGTFTAIMGAETVPLQERLERWAQRLQNLTVSPLTRDYPDIQNQEGPKRAIEAFESLKLPNDTASALQKLSGTSSGFTVFLTAFVVLVARLTGDEDIAIGTSLGDDGRPFVLRVPIDSSETFLQLYTKVQKVGTPIPPTLAFSDDCQGLR